MKAKRIRVKDSWAEVEYDEVEGEASIQVRHVRVLNRLPNTATLLLAAEGKQHVVKVPAGPLERPFEQDVDFKVSSRVTIELRWDAQVVRRVRKKPDGEYGIVEEYR